MEFVFTFFQQNISDTKHANNLESLLLREYVYSDRRSCPEDACYQVVFINSRSLDSVFEPNHFYMLFLELVSRNWENDCFYQIANWFSLTSMWEYFGSIQSQSSDTLGVISLKMMATFKFNPYQYEKHIPYINLR